MSKHTPGPWIIDCMRDNVPYLIANKIDVVCLFQNHARIKAENKQANANLISAAPDMLEMLEELVELKVITFLPEHKIHSLIAKAKGEQI